MTDGSKALGLAEVTKFCCAQDAEAFVPGYVEGLAAAAVTLRGGGTTPRDQDYRPEAICLRPAQPTLPPVLVLGGMGPLAGAQAFGAAVRRFGDRAEIVLLQATQVPDRSDAVAQGPGGESWGKVVSAMAWGLGAGAQCIDDVSATVPVVVACNTAHRFLPEALALARRSWPAAARLRPFSLIDAALEALRADPPARLLVAATEGTRRSRVYSQRLERARVSHTEPSQTVQAWLMRAIYDGVKALDLEATCRLGARFFDAAIEEAKGADSVLAGCTEVPEIRSAVLERGDPAARDKLRRLRLVDPVELALEAVETAAQPAAQASSASSASSRASGSK